MENHQTRKSKLYKPDLIGLLAAVAAGIIFTVYVFSPGYMTYDSVNQLAQGRQGIFNDWHPPVMSLLWGWVDRVVPGPIGMLALHSLLFWSGLGMWIYLIIPNLSSPLKALVVLGIGLFPPIFMLLSTIWKDVGLAASLVFASGWLVWAEQKRSLAALSVGLMSLWFGLALRHNAVFALFPLLIYTGSILYSMIDLPFDWLKRYRLFTSALFGLGLFGFCLLTTTLAGRALTHFSTTYPYQQILVHDLAVLSVRAEEVLLPDDLSDPRPATLRDLKKISNNQFGVLCLYNGCGVSDLRIKLVYTPEGISAILKAWSKAVLAQPTAYLSHRVRLFLRQFGVGGQEVCYPYVTSSDREALLVFGIDPKSIGPLSREPAITTVIIGAVEKGKNSLLFRGWIYLAFLTLVGLSALLPSRLKLNLPRAVVAVGASGWLYGLSYLPLSTTCDFRMHYWTVVAAVLCTPPLLDRLVKVRRG